MKVMTGETSVAANSTSANVLAGKMYEFLPGPATIRVFATAAAADIDCSLSIGGRVCLEQEEISAANRVPIIPDDFLAEDYGQAGERLFLKFVNRTAGALVARWRVEVL